MNAYFYLIMPYALDPEYQQKRDILKNAAEIKGLFTHFSVDNIQSHSSSIISEVKGALFIFADISYERPSCYYELGVAQGLNKKTFLVALSGTTIHQTEGKIHFYSNLEEYKQLVMQALNSYSP